MRKLKGGATGSLDFARDDNGEAAVSKAAEDCRSPKAAARFGTLSQSRSALECASPLALWLQRLGIREALC
jgi:hypothetical protein